MYKVGDRVKQYGWKDIYEIVKIKVENTSYTTVNLRSKEGYIHKSINLLHNDWIVVNQNPVKIKKEEDYYLWLNKRQ